MDRPQIGAVFPTGGPVPPDLIIGRSAEIADLVMRVNEGVHVLVTGPRRIGKTTVCRAACAKCAHHGALTIIIEVPERNDSRDLLQAIVDKCAGLSLRDEARQAFGALRPWIEKLLRDEGAPLDLSALGAEPDQQTARAILALPQQIAAQAKQRVVLLLDELQRVVDYADGPTILSDLSDLYGGRTEISLIIDGSDERSVEGMLGDPGHIGKLCERYELSPTIQQSTWHDPLRQRFASLGFEIDETSLGRLIDFGAGRPYATMLACRHAALTARRLGIDTINAFDVQAGIDAAVAQLEADGA